MNSVTRQVAMYIYKQPRCILLLIRPPDLGLPYDLGELRNLGLGGHVHIPVPDADNHAAQDGGIRLRMRRKCTEK